MANGTTATGQPVERRGRIPIDPDALMWALPLAVVAVIGMVWGWPWLWAPALIVAAAVTAFFRDPPRRGSEEPGAMPSPADGKVVAIERNEDPTRGPAPGHRITIFLSVLDVHINRSPCAGVVKRVRYEKGKFLDARDPRCSEDNESNWIFLESGRHEVAVRQIVGLIARRIVCRVREGQPLARGQRVGLIRFGSRTELTIPESAELKIALGDRVKGGETTIAILAE